MWTSRRLARLGCLLPLVALAFFLFMLFGWPHGKATSALEGNLLVVAICLVPLAAVAGIVLSTVGFVRAKRERRESGHRPARLMPLAAVVVAVGCVGFTALLLWALLEIGTAFR